MLWQPYKRDWQIYNAQGCKPAFLKPYQNGFLWQCGKRYGIEQDQAAAINWAETISEQYDLPAKFRSIHGLGR